MVGAPDMMAGDAAGRVYGDWQYIGRGGSLKLWSPLSLGHWRSCPKLYGVFHGDRSLNRYQVCPCR